MNNKQNLNDPEKSGACQDQPSTNQSEIPRQPPNHKHRLFAGVPLRAGYYSSIVLIDSINLSVEQAQAIVYQMQSQYTGDEEKSPDNVNFCTLQVIANEMLDIKASIDWYLKDEKIRCSNEH